MYVKDRLIDTLIALTAFLVRKIGDESNDIYGLAYF